MKTLQRTIDIKSTLNTLFYRSKKKLNLILRLGLPLEKETFLTLVKNRIKVCNSSSNVIWQKQISALKNILSSQKIDEAIPEQNHMD